MLSSSELRAPLQDLHSAVTDSQADPVTSVPLTSNSPLLPISAGRSAHHIHCLGHVTVWPLAPTVSEPPPSFPWVIAGASPWSSCCSPHSPRACVPQNPQTDPSINARPTAALPRTTAPWLPSYRSWKSSPCTACEEHPALLLSPCPGPRYPPFQHPHYSKATRSVLPPQDLCPGCAFCLEFQAPQLMPSPLLGLCSNVTFPMRPSLTHSLKLDTPTPTPPTLQLYSPTSCSCLSSQHLSQPNTLTILLFYLISHHPIVRI